MAGCLGSVAEGRVIMENKNTSSPPETMSEQDNECVGLRQAVAAHRKTLGLPQSAMAKAVRS